jgi:hypothetical protein
VVQAPGIVENHLAWMLQLADKNNIIERKGGLIFDEMSIQVRTYKFIYYIQ